MQTSSLSRLTPLRHLECIRHIQSWWILHFLRHMSKWLLCSRPLGVLYPLSEWDSLFRWQVRVHCLPQRQEWEWTMLCPRCDATARYGILSSA